MRLSDETVRMFRRYVLKVQAELGRRVTVDEALRILLDKAEKCEGSEGPVTFKN